jgi:hypothetical protein
VYDPQQVLQSIDDNVALVLALGGVALVCNYIFFGAAIRGALRDRCVPFLLIATAFWFPHDANYLLDFELWFDTYDHWFPKLFWVALIFTNAFEIVFIALTLRFGRDELAPQLSQRNFRLYVLGAVALGIVFWKVGKDAFADELYLATFMITVVWGLISGYGLLISRGSRRGQSPLQWAAYAGMAASYGALSIVVFGGAFDDLPWIALCVAGVAGGAGLAWLLSRAPDYARPTSEAGPLDEALLRAEAR